MTLTEEERAELFREQERQRDASRRALAAQLKGDPDVEAELKEAWRPLERDELWP